MKHDRRQEILLAAMELFAKKGFRGTTTRDLASHAEVNEAIIFRHFNNKEELYTAILEHKAAEEHDPKMEELERLATEGDDEKFFMALGAHFWRNTKKIRTSCGCFCSVPWRVISFRTSLWPACRPAGHFLITSRNAWMKEHSAR